MKQERPSEDQPAAIDALEVQAGPIVPADLSRRRKRRFTWALLLLLAGCAAAVFLWIRSTPAYALRKIRAALVERDAERFHAFVDLDAVIASAVRDFEAPPGRAQETGVLAKVRKTFVELTGLEKSARIKSTHAAIQAYWSAGEAAPAPAADEPLEAVLRRHLIDIGQTLKEKSSNGAAEPIVHTEFLLSAYDDALVEPLLRFQRVRGRLRLVEVVNFRDVLRAIYAAERRWKRAQNAAVEQEFARAASLASLSITKQDGLFGMDRKLAVRMTAVGLQKNPWLSMRGMLHVMTAEGEKHEFLVEALFGATGEGMVSSATLLLHEEGGVKIPPAVWDTPTHLLRPAFRTTGIRYADGKLLALPFPEIE